jgi:hypothetical protein
MVLCIARYYIVIYICSVFQKKQIFRVGVLHIQFPPQKDA